MNIPSSGISSLAELGVTASVVELNYCNGGTSAFQTQIDGKAASSHTHSAADITNGTLATARGGTNLSSYTANGVFYASSTSVMAQGNLTFDGTSLRAGPNAGYINIVTGITANGVGAIIGINGTNTFLGGVNSTTSVEQNNTERARWSNAVFVGNDSGADYDHRWEGDTDPNLHTLDAGNDSAAVGVALGSHPAGSKFTVATTTKAAIPAPKMTTTQRDLLGNLTEGLLIYNTTDHRLEHYDGSAWAAV